MLYPGEGSFEIFITLANLSKQLPTAISMVYPKILYLPSANEITCVFPPEIYSTVGFYAFVINLPI